MSSRAQLNWVPVCWSKMKVTGMKFTVKIIPVDVPTPVIVFLTFHILPLIFHSVLLFSWILPNDIYKLFRKQIKEHCHVQKTWIINLLSEFYIFDKLNPFFLHHPLPTSIILHHSTTINLFLSFSALSTSEQLITTQLTTFLQVKLQLKFVAPIIYFIDSVLCSYPF